MTPRTSNICVSPVSFKFDIMSIYSCGIIFALIYLYLYLLVRADGMVGADVFCVPTLGVFSLVLRSTIVGAGLSNLVGAVSLDICTNLGGTPGLSRRY